MISSSEMSKEIGKIFCYYAGFSSRKAFAKGSQAAVALLFQQFFLSINSQKWLQSAVLLVPCQCKPVCLGLSLRSGALRAHCWFTWCWSTGQKPVPPRGGGWVNCCPQGAQRIKPNIGNCILGCISGKSNPPLLPSLNSASAS